MSRQRTLKGTDGLDVPRLWQLMLLRLNVKLLRDCNRKAKYLLDVGNLVAQYQVPAPCTTYQLKSPPLPQPPPPDTPMVMAADSDAGQNSVLLSVS